MSRAFALPSHLATGAGGIIIGVSAERHGIGITMLVAVFCLALARIAGGRG